MLIGFLQEFYKNPFIAIPLFLLILFIVAKTGIHKRKE